MHPHIFFYKSKIDNKYNKIILYTKFIMLNFFCTNIYHIEFMFYGCFI